MLLLIALLFSSLISLLIKTLFFFLHAAQKETNSSEESECDDLDPNTSMEVDHDPFYPPSLEPSTNFPKELYACFEIVSIKFGVSTLNKGVTVVYCTACPRQKILDSKLSLI